MDDGEMEFEDYARTRPGAPFGWNPRDAFLAGFRVGRGAAEVTRAFPRHPELRSSGWSGAEQVIPGMRP